MNPSLAQLEAEAIAIPHGLGLPPCPQVLVDIGRELRSETPDVQKIAHLITLDAASAAMILKTVNSPYYGLSNKARSVQQAVAYLGMNRTACLLAGLLLRNAFPSTSKAAMARFWDASTEVAVIAARVARSLGCVDRGEAHTYGLFRDIGTAVLICHNDDYAAAAELDERVPSSKLIQWERERFGADHAAIGARLAADWQLPEEMREAILRHHEAFSGVAERPSEDALRHVAVGLLCDRIIDDHHGIQPNEEDAQQRAGAMRMLGLSDSVFAEMAAKAALMLDDVSGAAGERAASR
jgi:HD-like signal output (HDOD) protein